MQYHTQLAVTGYNCEGTSDATYGASAYNTCADTSDTQHAQAAVSTTTETTLGAPNTGFLASLVPSGALTIILPIIIVIVVSLVAAYVHRHSHAHR